MDVSKIENGTWKTVETHFPNVGGLKIEVVSFDEKGIMGRKICNVVTRDYDYKESHAELIAEAGTITNKCGFSPKELLEQRDQLLKVCLELRSDLFYQLESKFGAEKSSYYPSILNSDSIIKKVKNNER